METAVLTRPLDRPFTASDWHLPLGPTITLIGLAATVLIWVALGLFIHSEFRNHEAHAFNDLHVLARSLEAQVSARVESVDRTLRVGQYLYARDPAGFHFSDWTGANRDPAWSNAVLVDREGMARLTADGPLAPPVDMRARPGITQQLADPEDNMGISPPLVGPISGRRVIAFTRKLFDAAGHFDAVEAITLDADSFSSLYRDLVTPDGAIALVGMDRAIRARFANTGFNLDMMVPEDWVAPFRDGTTEVTARSRSPVDGVERFSVHRRVAHFPLIVSVSSSVSEVDTVPRRLASHVIGLGLALTLLIITVCVAFSHAGRTRRDTRRALEGAFANVSHGIMLVTPDHRVAVANPQLSAMLDLPKGLVVPGRSLAEIVTFQKQAGEFADDPPPSLDQDLIGIAPESRLYDRVRPNGSILQVRTEVLSDGSLVRSFTDVTEARRAAAAVAASRDKAEAAEATLIAGLENVLHGVLLTGADRKVLYVNERAIDLLNLTPEILHSGVSEDDITRLQLARGDLNEVPEVATRARAILTAGQTPAADARRFFQYQRNTPDGRRIDVRFTVLRDGRAVTTYTDITAQYAALQAEAEARRAAEAALRSRTEFLAVVTHELRTPLNGIIGLAGLMLAHSPPERHAEDIQMIEEAGMQLLSIVNDILDVAHLERGSLALREQPFDLRAMLRATSGLVARRATAKGSRLDLQIDDALPQSVTGDEARLRQVLLKLLDNAVKFTDAGTIAIDVQALPHTGAGCRLALSISDSGIGMDQTTLGRLFDPFMQADASYARRFGGLGLGLAICRLLVETMGGGITAESTPGEGSTFRVELTLPSTGFVME